MADWHARYRRIIDAYRGKLMEVSPAACNEVDDRMWGDPQTRWVANNAEIDLDKPMTAPELVERFGLARHDVQNWSRRHPEEIPVLGKRGNRNLYCVRDVLRYRNKRQS